ncbi:MAG: hypothetical protein JOZ46_02140 [Candidatus Dormibacteraeota bacterium]|nr:hypothetical protein [Candidatus Dormibacteraeota bacterium]MBV9524596.1 hypothetical protein [Candidatus Dormibacteraeota bacterium]
MVQRGSGNWLRRGRVSLSVGGAAVVLLFAAGTGIFGPRILHAAAASCSLSGPPGGICSSNGATIHIVSKTGGGDADTGLAVGNTVQISGTGFIANGKVSAEMCAGAVTGSGDCDINTAVANIATADASGNFGPVNFTISNDEPTSGTDEPDNDEDIQTTNQGVIECGSTGNCSIGVISNADESGPGAANPHSSNEDVAFGAASDSAGPDGDSDGDDASQNVPESELSAAAIPVAGLVLLAGAAFGGTVFFRRRRNTAGKDTTTE